MSTQLVQQLATVRNNQASTILEALDLLLVTGAPITIARDGTTGGIVARVVPIDGPTVTARGTSVRDALAKLIQSIA